MGDLEKRGVGFKSIDPEQNRFRFYPIRWQKTLCSEWTISSRQS
jgi:hypothetical protein